MTDRELIQKAAKAAGHAAMEWHRETPSEGGSSVDVLYVGQCEAYRPFRPLEDDGDALRLAVKLRITPHIDGSMTEAEAPTQVDGGFFAEPHIDDPYAATRRAIVRAAAAMAEVPAVGAA